MAEDNLLDSLDDGEGKPAPKKKLKLPSGGANLGANLVPILIGVVIVLNVFIFLKAGSGGGGGNEEGLHDIEEALKAFNQNQTRIITKLNSLNDPASKVKGVSVPKFTLEENKVSAYLAKGLPITMNVGKSSFARTKVQLIFDGNTLPHAEGEAKAEGKEGGGGDGHGGGEAAKADPAASPGPWFDELQPELEQAVQEFFSQVEYSQGRYAYGGEMFNRPQLRAALLNNLNTGLSNSRGDRKIQLLDVTLEGFIIQGGSGS